MYDFIGQYILLTYESFSHCFFYGHFCYSRRCVPGGFPLHFARLLGLPLTGVPGFEPDREYPGRDRQYPAANLNQEVVNFCDKLTEELEADFRREAISPEILHEIRIGSNGKIVDRAVKDIDEVIAGKEKEIMEI